MNESDIKFLLEKGFKQNEFKYSGFYYLETEYGNIVLIPKENYFKLEFYEFCEDGYEDYSRVVSNHDELLVDFIYRVID